MASTDFFEIEIEKLVRMRMLHVHFILLDVRPKSEFDSAHIPSAFNLEAALFSQKIISMVPSKEMPVVIYDNDGKTTASLLQEAANLGFLNVVGLVGGFTAYKQAGQPVTP